MANDIQPQSRSIIDQFNQLTSDLGNSIDHVKQLGLIASPAEGRDLNDFLCLQMHLMDSVEADYNKLREALRTDILPFAADLKLMRTVL